MARSFRSRTIYMALITLTLLGLSDHTQAKHDKTVGHKDSSISYSGTWQEDNHNGGSEMWSNDPEAKATYKFTGKSKSFIIFWFKDHIANPCQIPHLSGVAISYQVHLYPGNLPAGALLSVDNNTPDEVVLFDPNADDYGKNLKKVWSADNLQNGEHTLHVAYWDADLNDNADDDDDDDDHNDEDDTTYLTLDTLVVTVLDNSDIHSSSSSSSASSTSTSASATESATSTPSAAPDTTRRDTASRVLKYTGIAIGGLVALGLLATIIPYCYRRRLANQTAHNFVPVKGGSMGTAAVSQQAAMRSYDYSSVSRSDVEENPFIAPGETAYDGTPYHHHPQGATRYNS
ncbi:hypothetical protein D9758_005573 [Tetrapyrgos nigripes]|uniref:Uncharacterized protein n=1 Tax=Tetrapyrgos nigripes TaxID=182062 RepID=A0A8H5GGN4_9AGAR|nr:hypothetical protein D9758_005573 [Tetrapyrgos nigripes]